MSEQPTQGGPGPGDGNNAAAQVDPPPSPPSPPGPGRPPGVRGPVDRTGRLALWLGIGGLLLMFTPLFLVGLATALAALIVGIRARRRARRQHGVAPGAVGGIVMGSIALALSMVSLAMSIVIWPELSGYQRCMSAANTNTDEQACRDEWFPKIEDKLNMPRGSMDRFGNLF